VDASGRILGVPGISHAERNTSMGLQSQRLAVGLQIVACGLVWTFSEIGVADDRAQSANAVSTNVTFTSPVVSQTTDGTTPQLSLSDAKANHQWLLNGTGTTFSLSDNNATFPFVVSAGAPNNSLTIDSRGRVGLGPRLLERLNITDVNHSSITFF